MTPALGVECALPKNFRPYGRRTKRFPWLLLAMTLAGATMFGQGAYIQAKAWLAQILIERAWSGTLVGQSHVKPWPWADTHLALLRDVKKVERFEIDHADGARRLLTRCAPDAANATP